MVYSFGGGVVVAILPLSNQKIKLGCLENITKYIERTIMKLIVKITELTQNNNSEMAVGVCKRTVLCQQN